MIIDTVLGHDNERRARESILNIAFEELNLGRGRILLARGRETAPTFLSAIIAAEENGIITEGQVDNVLVADIITQTPRPTGTPSTSRTTPAITSTS